MGSLDKRVLRVWAASLGAAGSQPAQLQDAMIVRFRGLPPEEEVVRYARHRLTRIKDVLLSRSRQLEVLAHLGTGDGEHPVIRLRLRLCTPFVVVEASRRAPDLMQALSTAFDALERELASSSLRWSWSARGRHGVAGS